ncbi:MAG TPA: hypothetical protein VEB42_06900, partial [Chitinophagaceae bacterium]|nr:hypothetical protein [Chitinophagaceae bacterium]
CSAAFSKARAQQSFILEGLIHLIYSLSLLGQSALQVVRGYVLLAAEGCGRLKALYSAILF